MFTIAAEGRKVSAAGPKLPVRALRTGIQRHLHASYELRVRNPAPWYQSCPCNLNTTVQESANGQLPTTHNTRLVGGSSL